MLNMSDQAWAPFQGLIFSGDLPNKFVISFVHPGEHTRDDVVEIIRRKIMRNQFRLNNHAEYMKSCPWFDMTKEINSSMMSMATDTSFYPCFFGAITYDPSHTTAEEETVRYVESCMKSEKMASAGVTSDFTVDTSQMEENRLVWLSNLGYLDVRIDEMLWSAGVVRTGGPLSADLGLISQDNRILENWIELKTLSESSGLNDRQRKECLYLLYRVSLLRYDLLRCAESEGIKFPGDPESGNSVSKF